MGLEDFQQDSSSNSSGNNSTSTRSKSEPKKAVNSPSAANEAFYDKFQITPRAIKSQIKALGNKWVKQFSTDRFEEGELVMYGAGTNAKKSGETVMVFTTIQQVTGNVEPEDNKPIKVTRWNLEEYKPVGNERIIEATDAWKTELYRAIDSKLEELDTKG
jgi:hypothetical protein